MKQQADTLSDFTLLNHEAKGLGRAEVPGAGHSQHLPQMTVGQVWTKAAPF